MSVDTLCKYVEALGGQQGRVRHLTLSRAWITPNSFTRVFVLNVAEGGGALSAAGIRAASPGVPAVPASPAGPAGARYPSAAAVCASHTRIAAASPVGMRASGTGCSGTTGTWVIFGWNGRVPSSPILSRSSCSFSPSDSPV